MPAKTKFSSGLASKPRPHQALAESSSTNAWLVALQLVKDEFMRGDDPQEASGIKVVELPSDNDSEISESESEGLKPGSRGAASVECDAESQRMAMVRVMMLSCALNIAVTWKKIVRWFPSIRKRTIKNRKRLDGLAARVVIRHECVEMDLAELRDAQEGHMAGRTGVRYRAHLRDDTGVSLGKRAYYQFGNRCRDKADEIVTRKFLRDELDLLKMPDLRYSDAMVIIDMALDYSYLPTQHAIDRRGVSDTPLYRYRMGTATAEGTGCFSWLRALMPGHRVSDELYLRRRGLLDLGLTGGFGGHMPAEPAG